MEYLLVAPKRRRNVIKLAFELVQDLLVSSLVMGIILPWREAVFLEISSVSSQWVETVRRLVRGDLEATGCHNHWEILSPSMRGGTKPLSILPFALMRDSTCACPPVGDARRPSSAKCDYSRLAGIAFSGRRVPFRVDRLL